MLARAHLKGWAMLVLAAALAPPAHAAWGPGWDWDPQPVGLSTPGAIVGTPAAAVGRGGDAVVLWTETARDATLLRAASRPAGRAWQTSDPPLTEPDRSLRPPDVAIDGSGAAVAIWGEKVGDAPIVLRTARRPPGGPWQVDKEPLSTPGRTATAGQVGMSDRGEATAMWRQQTADPKVYVIRTATRAPGGDWVTAPDPVSTPGKSAGSPRLAVNGRGVATAIWHEETDTEPKNALIRGSWRPAGGAWQPPSTLSSPDAIIDAADHMVAIGDSGQSAAVWSQRPGISRYDTPHDVLVSLRSPDGAWSTTPETVSPRPVLYPAPQLAVDGAGVTTVVWVDSELGYQQESHAVRSARHAPGGAWEVEDLSPRGTVFDQSIGADAAGDFLAIWHHTVADVPNYGSRQAVDALRRPAGQGWQRPLLTLSDATISPGVVTLAMGADGTALAVWEDGYNPAPGGGVTPRGGVMARAFTPPPPPGQERPTGVNKLPSSRIKPLARRASSSRRRTISGTSRDRDGKVTRVNLAVVRTVHRGRRVSCRALRPGGHWASYRAVKRRCAPRFLMHTKGTTRWSIRLPRLPRAPYTLTSRAVDDQGASELRFGARVGNQRTITAT